MALITVKHSDPPCMARNFATLTAAVLHSTDAPEGCKHLPSGIMFHTAGNFVWVDASGTTVTTVITAESLGIYCTIAPAQIVVTSVPAVTVFWRK